MLLGTFNEVYSTFVREYKKSPMRLKVRLALLHGDCKTRREPTMVETSSN